MCNFLPRGIPVQRPVGVLSSPVMGWHPLLFEPRGPFLCTRSQEGFLDPRNCHLVSLLQQGSAPAINFVLGKQSFNFTLLDKHPLSSPGPTYLLPQALTGTLVTDWYGAFRSQVPEGGGFVHEMFRLQLPTGGLLGTWCVCGPGSGLGQPTPPLLRLWHFSFCQWPIALPLPLPAILFSLCYFHLPSTPQVSQPWSSYLGHRGGISFMGPVTPSVHKCVE